MSDGADVSNAVAAIGALSDFTAVAVAEEWARRFEETYDPATSASVSGEGYRPEDLVELLADVEVAERGLPRERSPVIARLILLAATHDDALRPLVERTLAEFRDDDLKAGAVLRTSALALALLALSSSSADRGPSTGSLARDVLAGQIPEIAQKLPTETGLSGLLAALDWLATKLNNRELSAVLNAISIGGVAKFVHGAVRFRRRRGRSVLIRADGEEIEVPQDKEKDIAALLGEDDGPAA